MSTDNYASEEDTRALLRKDARTSAERKLDRLLEERGASEQGAEPALILRQIALELLAEQPAQQRTEELLEIFKDADQCGPLLGMGAEQPAQQEPVAFYVYKPTLPRGNLGLVADGNLPWVYDQDPSSGFSARMMVTPVTSPPARHKPLTDEQVWLDDELMKLNAVMMLPMDYFMRVIRAIEAAHGIKENT